jgi:hypothetical protein
MTKHRSTKKYQSGGSVDDKHVTLPTRPIIPPQARVRPPSSLQAREEQLLTEREQGGAGALPIAERRGGPTKHIPAAKEKPTSGVKQQRR